MKIGKLAVTLTAAAAMGAFGSAFAQTSSEIKPPTPAPNIPDQEQPSTSASDSSSTASSETDRDASSGGSTVPSAGSTESSPSSDASVSDKPDIKE